MACIINQRYFVKKTTVTNTNEISDTSDLNNEEASKEKDSFDIENLQGWIEDIDKDSMNVDSVDISFIKGANAACAEGLESKNPQIAALADSFKQKLVPFQIKALPELRKKYIASIYEYYWENDIKVRSWKPFYTHINFIGTLFCKNMNIKTFNDALLETLISYRFKQARYAWVEYASPEILTIDSPSDSAIISN